MINPFHWSILLSIALGGSLGAMGRYSIAELTKSWLNNGLPLGTLIANIGGSFIMGVAFIIFTLKYPQATLLSVMIRVGFLGALTTFSSFALETVLLWQEGAVLMALVYLVLSVVGCMTAILLGSGMGRLLL